MLVVNPCNFNMQSCQPQVSVQFSLLPIQALNILTKNLLFKGTLRSSPVCVWKLSVQHLTLDILSENEMSKYIEAACKVPQAIQAGNLDLIKT